MVGVLVDGWRLEKKLFKRFKFNSETNKNWSERKHFSDNKKNWNEQLCCGNELKNKLNYKKTIK